MIKESLHKIPDILLEISRSRATRNLLLATAIALTMFIPQASAAGPTQDSEARLYPRSAEIEQTLWQLDASELACVRQIGTSYDSYHDREADLLAVQIPCLDDDFRSNIRSAVILTAGVNGDELPNSELVVKACSKVLEAYRDHRSTPNCPEPPLIAGWGGGIERAHNLVDLTPNINKHPVCHPNHEGREPGEAGEARALIDLIADVKARLSQLENIQIVDHHSYGEEVLYPYKRTPFAGKLMEQCMTAARLSPYVCRQLSYPAYGTWMGPGFIGDIGGIKQRMVVIETATSKQPPRSELERIGEEIWPMQEYFLRVVNDFDNFAAPYATRENIPDVIRLAQGDVLPVSIWFNNNVVKVNFYLGEEETPFLSQTIFPSKVVRLEIPSEIIARNIEQSLQFPLISVQGCDRGSCGDI